MTAIKEGGKTGNTMFVKIVAGSFHNAAIDREGHLYTWGDGSLGCLGHREVRNRYHPTLVRDLADKKVKQ